MSLEQPLAKNVFRAFQQSCNCLFPTASSMSQYIHLAVNEMGQVVIAQVFGDLLLTQEYKDQAAQVACRIFSQFKVQPNAIYQITLTADKASFTILGLEPLSGQVTSTSIEYVEVQTQLHRVLVPTEGDHRLEETVTICFQPLPIIQGEISHTAPQPPQVSAKYAASSVLLYSAEYNSKISTNHPGSETSSLHQSYRANPYPEIAKTDSGVSYSPPDLSESQVEVTGIDVERGPETSGIRRLPIRSLANYWRSNQQLIEKALSLTSRYTHWRQVKADGNAYYRSVAIGYLEYLCRNSTPPSLFFDFYMKVYEQRDVIIPDQLGRYYAMFLGSFRKLYTDKKAEQSLVNLQAYLQDEHFDLGAVAIVRCLALYSFEQLRLHPDYSVLLAGKAGDIIANSIMTVGREADNLVHQAIANALNTKIVHITLYPTTFREDIFQRRHLSAANTRTKGSTSCVANARTL